ncbi:aminoglycoside O-phosphotransferase APH(3'')-Ib [Microbacterium pseudoresistens]|uniref:Streptomycin 3'-kinase n=1 Tax=Microbacterium pseudoresistens TaxID=640634 RepID=A0A7Y9ETG9_9MICO|nr:APH(3'') family aminoglycoside O-phosphotransferase [Microbacterium pseudoresistens]NYD53657.1 streptomycin 3'-kinase [Microbacterium pseudoresistens]
MTAASLLDPRFDWTPIDTGESEDQVHRRDDGRAYAKVSPPHRVSALAGERDRLEWAAGRGLAVPQPLDWRETVGGACLVMTAIPGIPASELHGGDLRTAWPSMIGLLAALHEQDPSTCPFDRELERVFARAEDVVRRDAVNPAFLPDDDSHLPAAELLARVAADLPARLAREQAERVVCHGDPCLPNFLVDPGTLKCTGMIDLGRLGTADRYADLSLMLANAEENWDSVAQSDAAAEALFRTLGIPHPDRSALDFYLRLDPLTWG